MYLLGAFLILSEYIVCQSPASSSLTEPVPDLFSGRGPRTARGEFKVEVKPFPRWKVGLTGSLAWFDMGFSVFVCCARSEFEGSPVSLEEAPGLRVRPLGLQYRKVVNPLWRQ